MVKSLMASNADIHQRIDALAGHSAAGKDPSNVDPASARSKTDGSIAPSQKSSLFETPLNTSRPLPQAPSTFLTLVHRHLPGTIHDALGHHKPHHGRRIQPLRRASVYISELHNATGYPTDSRAPRRPLHQAPRALRASLATRVALSSPKVIEKESHDPPKVPTSMKLSLDYYRTRRAREKFASNWQAVERDKLVGRRQDI
jgi:hypothetical protein